MDENRTFLDENSTFSAKITLFFMPILTTKNSR
jgi:hypothetical protein